MKSRVAFMAALAAGWLASQAMAQHTDVLAYNDAGAVGVGEYDFDSLAVTAKRVFLARLDSFYSVNSPGFTARSGPTALPGNESLEWDFLPMTVDSGPAEGYVSTLLYWDGLAGEPLFGPAPTNDYRFSLFGKNGTAKAGGSDQLVAGYSVGTTGSNGFLHEHQYYFLDDNDDGLNTTLPQAGIYLLAMQLRLAGMETSDPFFLVWATPQTSVLPAIQPAAAWVNARVDTLVVDDSLLAGDFNFDGVVDAADYTVWRDGLGTVYESADYDIWSTNFGTTSGSPVQGMAVPEPTAVLLFTLALFVTPCRRNTTL